jgi:hypothetical protein
VSSASGNIVQKLETGFDINPSVEVDPDELVFTFNYDAPKSTLPKGSRLVQWVTFKHPDKKEKPMTLACTTLVGDPYEAHVITWKGFTSM